MNFQELKDKQNKRLEEFEANRQEAWTDAEKKLDNYNGNDAHKRLQVKDSNNYLTVRFNSVWDDKKITVLQVQKIELEHYIENLELKIEADKKLEELKRNEIGRKRDSGMSL